ncbi:MAG: hypothetical protein JNL45_11035 [Hyphomicrobium sp.]|nr:hypothetical protein [Hyphomicrobium sp.]
MHFNTFAIPLLAFLVGCGDGVPNCDDASVKQSLLQKLEQIQEEIAASYEEDPGVGVVGTMNSADLQKIRESVTYKLERIAERKTTENKRYCVAQLYARIDSEKYKQGLGKLSGLAQLYGLDKDLEKRGERNFSVQRAEDGSIFILLDD